VRRFRKFISVVALTLLLLLALGAGSLATAIYAIFGSGKALSAFGPTIDIGKSRVCSVVLIDLDRIDISRSHDLALLPKPQEKLRVTTLPEVNLIAALLPREAVDAAILGFDTCIAAFDSRSWTITHSALGQPRFDVGESTGLIVHGSGTTIKFDVEQASSSTLIISTADQGPQIEQITLDAELRYPQANTWALVFAISSGVLIALFIALTVIYKVKVTKRAQS